MPDRPHDWLRQTTVLNIAGILITVGWFALFIELNRVGALLRSAMLAVAVALVYRHFTAGWADLARTIRASDPDVVDKRLYRMQIGAVLLWTGGCAGPPLHRVLGHYLPGDELLYIGASAAVSGAGLLAGIRLKYEEARRYQTASERLRQSPKPAH